MSMFKRILLTAAAFCVLTPMPARAVDDLLSIYKGYEADSQKPLDQPHRSVSELSDLVSDIIANALVYTPGKDREKLASLKAQFTEQGYNSYLTFLASYNLSTDITQEDLNLASVVNSTPVLIGQGASAGRYAWAFEMPLIMTITNGVGPDAPAPVSKKVILRVQIGRSAKATNEDGVLIESWQEFKNTGGQP